MENLNFFLDAKSEIKLNKTEISFTIELMRFTESEFLKKVKELSFEDIEKEQLKKVVLALIIYGYKSYKATLHLFKGGYYTNGLISCRTLKLPQLKKWGSCTLTNFCNVSKEHCH